MPPVRQITEQPKSWRKINEERKLMKKKRKQERILKNLEKTTQLEHLTEDAASTAKEAPRPTPSTVSIAVPGSILENAQSAELRSYVAGQIARAACIFRVNEVVIFDDVGVATARETKRNYDAVADETGDVGAQTVRASSLQLARILQYLECPQYLRKFFFPLHKDLKYSGLLNPLDAPHHLRQQNQFLYREGVVVGEQKKAKEGHSYVNVGLLNDVLVDKAIAPGVRVTVKLENNSDITKKLRGTVVSPEEPRRETGVYWGYNVRIAHSFSEIFTQSPFEGGYDLTIGTSDRGKNVHEVPNKSYNYNHLLIVFGGLKGLEVAISNDDKLNIDDPALLFDHYVNVLPLQGSRTIRTEEALLVALAALQEKLTPQVEDVQVDLSAFLPRSQDTGGTVDHDLQPQQFTKKQKSQKANKNLKSVEERDEGKQLQVETNNNSNNLETTNKTFEKKQKNPFKPAEMNVDTNNDDFHIATAKHVESKRSKGKNEDFSRMNGQNKKTKNPFKAAEVNEVQDGELDFEIVTATPSKRSKSSAGKNEDFSRVNGQNNKQKNPFKAAEVNEVPDGELDFEIVTATHSKEAKKSSSKDDDFSRFD